MFKILTYKNIADTLGVSVPAAKQRVRHNKWARKTDNHNNVVVHIPSHEWERILSKKGDTQKATRSGYDSSSERGYVADTLSLIEKLTDKLNAQAHDNSILSKKNGILEASVANKKATIEKLHKELKEQRSTLENLYKTKCEGYVREAEKLAE